MRCLWQKSPFVEKTKLKLMQKFVWISVEIRLYQKCAIVSVRKM